MKVLKRLTKDALVLSGGGAKGAYEVGVMKALFEGKSPSTNFQPLSIDILTGTSVGAYNAAFLASQDVPPPGAIRALETVWRERVGNRFLDCGNGVFDLRDGPLSALDPGCAIRPFDVLTKSFADAAFWTRYAAVQGVQLLAERGATAEGRLLRAINLAALFDPTPLHELIRETIDPCLLAASDNEVIIAATNWNEGTLRLFDKAELSGSVGPLGIAASAAIPGIFPPILIDEVLYHDGGVLMNTPLKPAIGAGANTLHVIFLDPKVANIPLDLIPNTVDTVYRMFLIMSAINFNTDIQLAESILRELELNRDLEILSSDMTMFNATSMKLNKELVANSRVLRRVEEGRPYNPLTIHSYRPRTDLDGGIGLLNFSAKFIGELIDLGYHDAVHHDCHEQGCVMPRART